MADLTITPLPDTEIDPYERIYCNGAFFGEPITVRQVYEAANTLSDFQGPVDYQSINPNAPNYIPQEYYSDDRRVVVSLEIVGPPTGDLQLIPNNIRKAVGWIVRECVNASQVGGFATLGREDSLRYPALIGDPNGSFLGVTVSLWSRRDFGNSDPTVMSDIVHDLANEPIEDLPEDDMQMIPEVSRALDAAVVRMVQYGGNWWDYMRPLPTLEGVSCNASKFGKPDERSCYLMLQQLPAGNVSLDLSYPAIKSAGSVTRGCVAIVRSQSPISMAWSQLKNTIEEIIAVCLHNPMAAIAGGMLATSALATTISNPQLPNGVSVTLRSW